MKLPLFFTLVFTAASLVLRSQDRKLDFDGLDDYIQVADHVDFDFSGDFTVEVKFKRHRLGIREDILNKKELIPGSPSENDLGIFIETNGMVNVLLRVNVSKQLLLQSTSFTTTADWMHVAVVRSGSNCSLYINGLVEASGIFISDITSNGPLRIGSNRLDSMMAPDARFKQPFSGLIDEVRFWNLGRSASQIQNNMNSQLIGNEPGLTAYYDFNQGVPCGYNPGVTNAIDRTGNGHTGLLNNFALSGGGASPCTSNWVSAACLVYGPALTAQACSAFQAPSGQILTTSGIYSDWFITSSQCDSIITINLSLTGLDTEVSQYSSVLTSLASGVTYQWLDCNNGYTPIPGATGKVFTATMNGSYAVALAQDSCLDTSMCYVVNNVGINDPIKDKMQFFPNPSKGILYINPGSLSEDGHIVIHNILGEIVFEKPFTHNESTIEFPYDLADGVYFFSFRADSFQFTERIILQRY